VFQLFIIISNAYETFKFFYDVIFNSTFKKKENVWNDVILNSTLRKKENVWNSMGESMIKCTTKIRAGLLVK
jgi:hypothetical protein